MKVPRQHGFTLIELMITASIVGVLATVAVPSFQLLLLRTKMAERTVVMTAIRRSMDDLWVRDQAYPTVISPTESWLYLLSDNPDSTPGASKRPWRSTSAGAFDQWNQLTVGIEGSVYYSYGGYAYVSGNTRVYDIYAYGDLDGDGVQNRWTKQWVFVNEALQPGVGGTLPCGDCSVGYDEYPGTF
jgi:prepilin-type N-terminal cleavage/methylation domain-containing protein